MTAEAPGRVVTRALIDGGRVRITDLATGTSRALSLENRSPGQVTVRVRQAEEKLYRVAACVGAEWHRIWPDVEIRVYDRKGWRVAFHVTNNLRIDRLNTARTAAARSSPPASAIAGYPAARSPLRAPIASMQRTRP